MIVTCDKCKADYDDAYRWTICPHETFAANDGKNNFAHHAESVYKPKTQKEEIAEVERTLEMMWKTYVATPDELFCSLGGIRKSMRMSFVFGQFLEVNKHMPDDTLVRISKHNVELVR